MRVIFLGRKPEAIQALDFLLERGWEVPCLVCPQKTEGLWWRPTLLEAAADREIPVVTQEALSNVLMHPQDDPELGKKIENVDLVISYLYWRRIKEPLLGRPLRGAVNFHPAPLPDYRGVGGYNFAILNGERRYGVSAHYIDSTIDTGELIARRDFPIDAEQETAYSLYQKSQRALLELFFELIPLFETGRPPGTPQGAGRYYTREEFEAAKEIPPGSDPAEIDRRARAFWFPPYSGAYFADDPTYATVVTQKILHQLGGLLHDTGGEC
jgi:methionyl-tRNA formyltransferase